MTVSDFYLICFLVGFSVSVLSAWSGSFHLHLPGMHHGHGIGHRGGLSVFNVSSMAAFLAWFGGIGFLLSKFSGVWLWFVFSLAVLGGLIGCMIVLWFLKLLLSHERPLNALDYDMVGVLGRLTAAIRPGGVGEITFSQEGVRRSVPARSEDGSSILKNMDVLVTRYEKGVAYVRRWEDLNSPKETL